MSILSEKLRKAREEANLTQQQASHLSGIGYKTINNYENAVSKPDVEKLAILCKAYNVTADYFLDPYINRQKESSAIKSTAEDSSQIVYDMLYKTLIENNIIKEGEDITPQQLLVLQIIGELIINYF